MAASRVSRPAFRAGMFSRPFPPRGKRAAVWAEALPTAFPAAERRPPAHRAGPVLRGLGSGGGLAVFGVHNRCLGRGGSRSLPRCAGKALLFGPRRFPRPFPWWRTGPAPIARGRFCVSGVRVGLGRVAGSSRCLGRRASHGLPRRRGTAPRSSRGAGLRCLGSGGALAVFRVPWPVLGPGRVQVPSTLCGKGAAVRAGELPVAFPVVEDQLCAWHRDGSRSLPRCAGNALLFGPGRFPRPFPWRRNGPALSARGRFCVAWVWIGALAVFWVPWPVLGPGWVQVPFPRRGKGAAVRAGALPTAFPVAKERPRAHRAGPVRLAGFRVPPPALRAGFPRLPLSRPAPRPATLPRRASARGMAGSPPRRPRPAGSTGWG